MQVLIIGSNGQLGKEMQRKLSEKGVNYGAYDIPDIDITDISSIERIVKHEKYQYIINCAAYTDVDGAETNYELAYQCNAIGPKNISIVSDRYNAELVHISTDYVFSGEGILNDGKLRPYVETDACLPTSAYGKSKLAGEEFVCQHSDKSYILRTAWLYGDGNNFVKTMLRLADQHNEIKVVNDQIGSPTSSAELAEAIFQLMGSGHYGIYHATCEGLCSWYEFAKEIFKITGLDVDLKPIQSADYPRPAKRPAWSVLENAGLKRLGMNHFCDWKIALRDYLQKQ